MRNRVRITVHKVLPAVSGFAPSKRICHHCRELRPPQNSSCVDFTLRTLLEANNIKAFHFGKNGACIIHRSAKTATYLEFNARKR